MPKKYDPDCPLCRAVRTEADSAVGRFVARLERSALFLDNDLRGAVLVAHTHIGDVAEMHEHERQIFDQDIAQTMQAVAKVAAEDIQTKAVNADGHLHLRLEAMLAGDAELCTEDLREGLGYIRKRVTDPLLRNWVDKKGRIFDWPNLQHPEEQDAVRAYLAGKFQPGRAYTEKQVTELLNQWATFGDWAMLRRELFMHGFVHRYKDGSKYWVGDEEPEWD